MLNFKFKTIIRRFKSFKLVYKNSKNTFSYYNNGSYSLDANRNTKMEIEDYNKYQV